jgi:hypothetical protein
VLATAIFAVASPSYAGPDDFSTDFASPPTGVYYTNFEGGLRSPDTPCGVDACASFETSDGDAFLRVAINPSATAGYFTNTDVSQVDLNQPGIVDSGPYTATAGHPVTLTARIRWSGIYNANGGGAAVGTSGIVLWNSPFIDPTVGPEAALYDHIGFTWASNDTLLGMLSGFGGTTVVDQWPVGISRPAPGVNIHQWMNVSLVWSADPLGSQTVAYYLEGNLLGLHALPVPLQGLSLEIWTDNQEPDLCPDGVELCYAYPNPVQTQSLEIDSVSITQD